MRLNWTWGSALEWSTSISRFRIHGDRIAQPEFRQGLADVLLQMTEPAPVWWRVNRLSI